MHTLPAAPHTAALGTTRVVGTDQTVRFGSVRYSLPPGLVGAEVWVRVVGTEVVIVADTARLPSMPSWAGGVVGLVEAARHQASTPGTPRIDPAHYPDHPQEMDGTPRPPRPRARTQSEAAFLDLGDGAHAWLVEASAAGTVRVRAKMADAVQLAALVGAERFDAALGLAAAAGRFGQADLASIVDHLATGTSGVDLGRCDETVTTQPGTGGWAGFTTGTTR